MSCHVKIIDTLWVLCKLFLNFLRDFQRIFPFFSTRARKMMWNFKDE